MDGTSDALPRQARIFESGLHRANPNTASFDVLIRENLDRIARNFSNMGADSLPTPPAGPLLSEESATLLRELGDYFTRTAQMWSMMTHNLLQGPHIDHISTDVNTRSNNQTGLADLVTSAAVDVEISRLRYVPTPPPAHIVRQVSHTSAQEDTGFDSQVFPRRPSRLAS